MKPSTSLPWVLSSSVIVCDSEARVIASLVPMDVVGVSAKEQFANAPYIVHACNAYPRLVAALKLFTAYGNVYAHAPEQPNPYVQAMSLLKELGES